RRRRDPGTNPPRLRSGRPAAGEPLEGEGAMSANPRSARRPSSDRTRDLRNDRVSQAYRQLRELIIWGRLAPGTRIIETDVAARLGVSRTPVRSALQRLQQEGYIVASGTGQQSRLAVAPLTREDARELFAIVAEVEALGAQWAEIGRAHV